MFAEMSDAALVQCVAKGQHEAEAEVCRRLGPRIRLYGLRHLHSASGVILNFMVAEDAYARQSNARRSCSAHAV